MPDEGDVLQRIVPIGQSELILENIATGHPTTVVGFVAPANDVVQFSTPAEVFDGVGLGYVDQSGMMSFSPDADVVRAIRFPATADVLDATDIPRVADLGGSGAYDEGYDWPFTGNGFVSSPDAVAPNCASRVRWRCRRALRCGKSAPTGLSAWWVSTRTARGCELATSTDPVASGATSARVSGMYASYRGSTYSAGSYLGGRGRGYAILRISAADRTQFADVLEGEPLRAKVPLGELDGLIRVTRFGRFAGHDVMVTSIEAHRVCFVANWPGAWGREHHLDGSQNDGFRGCRPPRDVEIGEEVFDILAAEIRRKSRNL